MWLMKGAADAGLKQQFGEGTVLGRLACGLLGTQASLQVHFGLLQKIYAMKQFILILMGCALLSCNDKTGDTEPRVIADFTMEIDVYDYYKVHFVNRSENAISYVWDFDDGDNSNLENPTHKYAHAGIYDVSLRVQGANGTEAVKTRTLIIVEPH